MSEIQLEPKTTPAIGPKPRPAFFGPFGLRAGWSASLYIVLLVLFIVGLGSAATWLAVHLAGFHPPTSVRASHLITPMEGFLQEIPSILALFLAAIVLAAIERRRISVYGLGRARLADFLPGLFWGVLFMAIVVAILRACHVLVFDQQLLYGVAALKWGAIWLLCFFTVGLSEEYLLRGFLQYTLTRGFFGLGKRISPAHTRLVAFWLAAITMSIVFAVLHISNGDESFLGLLQVFEIGMIFSYALWHTGSLWWAIGVHTGWDWAQSFLFGAPDSGLLSTNRLFNTHYQGNPLLSGGQVGPEGSILSSFVLLLLLLVIRFTTRQGAQPPLEPRPLAFDNPQEAAAPIT